MNKTKPVRDQYYSYCGDRCLFFSFPGKTAIIQRYTKGHFSPNYKLTIGVDFAVKTLTWDPKTKIILQLW